MPHDDHDSNGVSVPARAVAGPPERRRLVPVRPEHLYKAVALFFLLAFLYHFFPLISEGLLLLYTSVIFAVFVNAIVTRIPLQRKWMTGIVALLIFGGLAAALYFGIPVLIGQLRNLASQAPAFQERLQEWQGWIRANTGLNVQLAGPQVQKFLRDTFLSTAGGGVLGRAQSLLTILFYPLLILIGGFFAAANPNDRLLTPLLRAVPRDLRPAFRRMFELLGARLLGWMRGVLIGMLAVGLLSWIGYSIVGVPNSLLLALFAGLTEAIPLVGPFIGGGVATVVAFLQNPTMGLWAAVVAIAVQQIENNLIIPFAMAKAADVHPFVTLFALVIFGLLWGFLGVLLAVPLVLLFWTIIEVLWVERAIDTDEDRIEPVVED